MQRRGKDPMRRTWTLGADTYRVVRQPRPSVHIRHQFEGRGSRNMGEFIGELWAFMRERKKFWLLPIVCVLLLFGSLLVFTQGTVVAPFIYTLF